MATDIPLQSESEFTSDMVKAVENIAVNVKLGSAEFSSSIDSLSKAIDGLKSSLIDSINSLKASASNVAPSSPSAAPRASQGRSPSAQDPAVARQKEEEKKIKAETKALNIKTAQERAIFNAKKLQLQIESANEGKTTRRKKADADTQQQSIEDVFENVGKGFGDVFAVTKEQVSAMTKSGKKGKKEKPFEMDMGSLATASKAAGPGVDLPKSFIIGASDASDVWKNVFSEITVQTEKYRANQADISSLMDDIRSTLGDATDQAQVFSSEMEAALDSRTYFEQAQDALDSLIPPDVNEFEQLFNDLGAMFEGVIPDLGMNEGIIPDNPSIAEPVEPYYSPFIGMPEEQPPLVGPTQKGAREYQLKQEDASIKKGVDSFSVLFEAMFGKMGKSIQNVIATTVSGINQSFSDNSPVLDAVKSMFGASPAGEIAEEKPKGEPKEKPKEKPKGKPKGGTIIPTFDFEAMDLQGNETKDSIDASTEQEAQDMIRQMGLFATKITKSKKGTHFETESGLPKVMENIGLMFSNVFSLFGGGSSGSSNNNDTPTKPDEGFPGGINGDEFDTPKPQKLSSGGTVGYFAKGTPKGGVFEGIGSVLGGKKKKKKSLLNNDEGDFGSIFKPKGTDKIPAMLTPGEEVVKESAAKKPENKKVIDAMNKSSGGKVGYFAGGTPGGGGKGIVGGLASLALGPVGAAFSVLTGSVKAASDAIGMFGSFVAKNNPAIMEQVNLAMNDLQGVIGRALVPVVQRLIPVLRFLGDGVDFVMKMLMPAITPIANAFATLAIPLIALEAVVAQFLAPAFEIVAVAVEGFAIMLDPVIQLLAEIVESFTALVQSFLDGIPITKIMKDGFEILGQVVKMLVGVIVSVLGLFMSGMGVILQLAGLLISGFGSMVKGIGDLLSYIPGMKTIGSALSSAGTAVGDSGKAVQASGSDLQKKGEEQRDRGLAKMGEGFENIVGKFSDPDYKMKDNTRYKSGDVTGVGIKKGSSVGAAVRETQSTSISGVGDEVRKQALMAATGAKTQEESLKDISDKLSKDNLRDAFKEGMIAANGADKGNAGIQGKDPFAGADHSKPSLSPV